jgi:hypothetical protein
MQTTFKKSKNPNYTIESKPFIISGPGMVFSGETVARPSAFYVINEKSNSPEDMVIIERYFSDIQNLFLKKLSVFVSADTASETESIKLRALLEEMIKVRQLILSKHQS